MKLWIDTEFNDYKGELISMALVDELGNEWYEALNCIYPTEWVKEHVIPVINKPFISKHDMQISLETFLAKYDSVHIIADWPEDVAHFCNLLITGPGKRLKTPPLTMEVLRHVPSSNTISDLPHNALEDAKGLKKYLKYPSLC